MDQQAIIEPQIHERFIDLMCNYNPSGVYNFIKTTEGYRLEQTLVVSCNNMNFMSIHISYSELLLLLPLGGGDILFYLCGVHVITFSVYLVCILFN